LLGNGQSQDFLKKAEGFVSIFHVLLATDIKRSLI